MKKIILLFVCLSALAYGVETQFYTFKGMDGFGKPVTTDGVGIHSKGYLTLIPKVEILLSPPEEIVWSLVKSGKVIYAGVGETGNIMYIAEDGKSGVLSKLGKMCVKALAAGKNGAVYAGGPDGIIYKFTDIVNQSEFYTTGEKYVWSLTFDKDGTCYAGTGPEGKIFRITPDGKGELLYDGEEKHILSMTASDGYLYAGTGGEGVIYKIDIQAKKGSVLAELPGQEIVDICMKGKDLYAVSNPGAKGASGPKPKPAAPKSGPPRPVPKVKRGSSIFKVSSEKGETALFFAPAAGTVTSVALLDDGRIAAGVDVQGTIYLIEDKDKWIVFSIPNVGKVRDIYPVEKGFLAGTEKKGFISRFSLDGNKEGEYISNVCEIPEVDRWGILESEVKPKDTPVKYLFRTGKVKNTDENWSTWKEVTKGDLSVLDTGNAFFQMKLEIRTPDAKQQCRIQSLKLSYRPVNKKPEIQEFKILQPGNATGRRMPGPPRGGSNPQASRVPPKPVGIQLMWKCIDPNRDPVLFTISRKFEGGNRWIKEQKDLMQPKTMLDTSLIPDGKYRIKLTASDEKANITGKGFIAEKELDECIIVDKTPPEVTIVSTELTAKSFTVKSKAKDAFSPLRGCSYRINDDREWQSVTAKDLLYDELEEETEFLIDRKDIKEGDVIIVRYDDDAMNYQLVRIEVKP